MSEIKVNSIKGVAASAAAISVDNSNGTCTLASGSKLNNCTTDGTTNLTIADGNLIVGTSGHGIDFGATSDGSGSSQQELFNDYEEGNWTPTLFDASTGGNQYTVGYITANYVKIGRLVHCYAQLRSLGFNTTGGNAVNMTQANGIYIRGFPYQANGIETHRSQVSLEFFTNFSDDEFGPYMQLGNNTTTAELHKQHNGLTTGNPLVKWGDMTLSYGYFNFHINMSYRTST